MASLQFHFRNFNSRDMQVGVNHAGCGGAPWADGRPNCWGQRIPYNPTGGHDSVYVPSSWVVDFGAWLTVIVDGLKLLADTAIVIADDGDDLSGAISDIFKLEKAIVEAEAEKQGVNLTALAANARKSLDSTCQHIGVSTPTVTKFAEQMGYGSTSWAFLGGSSYVNNIHNDSSPIVNGYGWSIFENEVNSQPPMRIANHAYIINGSIVQVIADGVINEFWSNGPPWPST